MSNVQVSVFARTDIGMQRSGNEDAFMVADLTTGNVGLGPDMSTHPVGARGSLMVVSDGMGGAVAGEIASEMAVTSIRESLMEIPTDLNVSERLKMATEIANEKIWEHAQQNPELSGMGATVTAVLVQGTTAYIGQVGDSRAYLVRGDQIKQLTKDQSLAQMLIDSGAITPEQVSSVPQNVIMQALGTQPTVKVALTAVELFRNDCLLICSDGLSNKIQAIEMREMAQSSTELTATCRRLVEMANERGGEDNITVIIARFDGEALQTGTDSSSITGSFKAINQEYYGDRGQAAANPNDHRPNITTQLASPLPPTPPDKEATTLVMAALPSSVNFEDEHASSSAEEVSISDQTPLEHAPLTEPQTAQSAVADSSAAESAAAQAPVTAHLGAPEAAPVARRRKSYAGVLILGLVSVILILAAGYFYYEYYWKPQHQQKPAAEQQQEGAADEQQMTPEGTPPQDQKTDETRPPAQDQPQSQPNANSN
ncbi:MAG TPA: PP2C family serine/threonine-protein phosphatase [Blastocatellia bacterium]|nr:PP2C family serine/threonine-protein phosphatase [Blastocatellia bacterium]